MRPRGSLVLAGLALLAAGCGAGQTTASVTHPGGGAFPAPGDTTATAPATTTSVSTTTHGTGASPGGLAPTRGYGTYELCQGTCTGAVPSALRRPLSIPAADGGPCPVTLHPTGPVTPSTSTQVGFRRVTGSAWLAAAVTWAARGSYAGPVLIRGRQIGGGGAVGFGAGLRPYAELQLLDAGQQAPPVAGGGRAWVTDARIATAGCYAFQVDGTTFTEVIVFRAVT